MMIFERAVRCLMPLIIGVLFGLSSLANAANEVDAYPFDSAGQEAQFWSLLTALRCPTCQNQSLADSDAAMAKSLRQTTYEQVKAGKTDAEIVAFMTARYGDFISYKPRVNAYTIWLWLIPLWAMVFGVYLVLRQFNPKASELSEAEDKPVTLTDKDAVQSEPSSSEES